MIKAHIHLVLPAKLYFSYVILLTWTAPAGLSSILKPQLKSGNMNKTRSFRYIERTLPFLFKDTDRVTESHYFLMFFLILRASSYCIGEGRESCGITHGCSRRESRRVAYWKILRYCVNEIREYQRVTFDIELVKTENAEGLCAWFRRILYWFGSLLFW